MTGRTTGNPGKIGHTPGRLILLVQQIPNTQDCRMHGQGMRFPMLPGLKQSADFQNQLIDAQPETGVTTGQ